MSTTTTPALWEMESTSYGEVEFGDFVLADPIYGAEEVIGEVRKQWLSGSPNSTRDFPANLQKDWYALHLQLRQRGAEGTARFVIRFPHEPVLKIKVIPGV